MKTIIVLVLLLLQAISALAASDISGVSEGGVPKESSTLAPDDFGSKINSSNENYSNENHNYKNIDQYAMNAPASAEASVETLASYLVAPAKNEREKARSIFRWVTENIDYDDTGFFTGNFAASSSKDVLKSRKSVCSGYSDIFSSLARSAGLEVVRISGYGKGYGYLPGESLSGPFNHAWNAVKIKGSWYLIDCTWGAGYIDENKKYVRKFDEHYFMTPPSQFIFSHFPLDSRWQLLERPLSKSEFEKQVYVKPEFFKYGLKLGDHLDGTIRADKRINISIYSPNDVLLIADLRYLDGKLLPDTIRNSTFCERDGNSYDIFVQFTKPGIYILKAYARHKDEPGEYHGVIEYRINASAKDTENPGFPMTYGKFTEVGAYLYSPMEGRLKSGGPYWFKIRVPNALNVTVVCQDKWSYLSSSGDTFEGNVTPGRGDVLIAAKFQKESYDGLLKYVGY